MNSNQIFKTFIVSFAITISTLSSISSAQTAPTTLFHWTSTRGLNRWDQNIRSQGEFKLKPILESLFTTAYPEFAGKDGVFAWTDVAGGTGAFIGYQKEWYAREDQSTGEPARLVAIFMEPGTPMATLDTYLEQTMNLPQITKTAAITDRVMNVGVILHRIIDNKTGEIFLQEYIVLKRRYISGITADPKDIAPYIDESIRRLQDPTPLPKSALHTVTDHDRSGLNNPRTRQTVMEILERAKNAPSYQTPDIFRSNGTIPEPPMGNGLSCRKFFY